MQTEPMPRQEWKDLLSSLDDSYSVFASLYSISRPSFSKELPTAAVYFNRAGNCIDLKINHQFWKGLSRDEKVFVLSHEALHIFLNHGKRIKDSSPKESDIVNRALDVVINHTLVDKFRHERKKVDKQNEYCWLDTVFKDDTEVKPGQNYEYYFARLREKRKERAGKPVNDHSGLKSFGEGQGEEEGESKPDKQLEDLLKRIVGPSEMKELAGQLAGVDGGGFQKIVERMQVYPKKKWETVIKKWSAKFTHEREADQFVLTNRRFALMPREDVFLPTEAEYEGVNENRIDVWFFLDTSGSCAHLADRFFKASDTLPRTKFNVKLLCFDTAVYEVDPKTRTLSGFGGTSFSCIEQFIQGKVAAGLKKYPTCFLITDGCGDPVSPAQPDKWFWFLTMDYKDYIPARSKCFNLADFE